MPRTKWTPKELKEIWSKGIKCFPEPAPGVRYGASDDFMPLFINNYDIREKFKLEESFELIKSEFIHAKATNHRFVGDLMWGPTGTSKTTTAVGLGMEYAFRFPGSSGMVGGRVYGDLKENVISQYQKLLSIKSPWDHPAVKSHPSMTSSHNKKLILEPYPGAMWSEIEFFQMDDWERVRGRNRDWMHLEEISQFTDDSIIDEAPRRLRGRVLPVSHLFCTTNPPETTSHWVYHKWHIFQYLNTYTGPKTPIGSSCKCQYCQACLEKDLGEFPWLENGECSNPKCAFISTLGKRARRDIYPIKDSQGVVHQVFCPGNEYYWRALFSDASSNLHKRADYLQTIIGSSDAKVAALYAKGTPTELNSNNAYRTFSQANILEKGNPIGNVDYEKDLHLSSDFNTRPQCSVLCQETYLPNGELDYVVQVDEIILFDIREVVENSGGRDLGAGPEHIAEEIVKRYPNFKKTIYMWGDPTAVNKSTSPLERTKFQIIHDILTKAGFKVEMMVKKEKGQIRLIPLADRINNANWLFRNNENKIKFYINSKCEYTITSVRDIKLDKTGQSLDKRNIDEYARRTTRLIYPEDVYKRIIFVSHPGDALTYYLFQRFPLIKDVGYAFFSIPGEVTYKIDGNKIIESKSNIKEENEKEAIKSEIYLSEPQPTLLEILQGQGAFGEEFHEEENFFRNYFGF